MAAPLWGILLLGFALLASSTLGAGSAYLVVRWTKRPILWVLTPVFAVVWLAIGLTPFVATVATTTGPTPAKTPIPGPQGADTSTPPRSDGG